VFGFEKCNCNNLYILDKIMITAKTPRGCDAKEAFVSP
jgi:hypothetical protein